MIKISDLYKSYGKNQVLQGIDLEIQKGQVHGLVGENGAGKTTLFRCLAGLESHSGQIQSDIDILKDNTGFLQTNPYFLSKITGWEYLKLLCSARNIKDEDFESKNIFELPLKQYAENYSTGMKKKLALTGILLQQNKVFILDEPFNGVDIHSNIMINEIINKLRNNGKYILISSHIFSSLSNCCDRIHLLKNGKIEKTVIKKDFEILNKEMKSFVLGDRLENFKIK
ncbi:MAG: ATP-binding cassette domain-containing protein [Saprospiraceae bacterium]|nr:ATP-binding cassette domain-containing protein [Bacteroidia bacterium]NNF20990.1 ATP-binding cassette domain-containing protein [Saprospiraceae bacterium]NNK89128.1 ATP-binding cassette domain-containing protein [Saprospiraceae bacterium]